MNGHGRFNPRMRLYGGIGLIVLIIFSIFMFSSFATIDTTEVGFTRNWVSKEIDDENIYSTGIYWIGFFNSFVKFETTVQTINFLTEEANQLNARTKDGLSIKLDISFQYRIQPQNIQKLYRNYTKEYESTYTVIARDDIRDVSSNFTAIEFYNNRTIIGEKMLESLQKMFSMNYADVVMLQLRNIDLPDSFEQALEDKEVARQDYEVALREQEAALVRANTEIFLAQAAANVTLIQANASAEAYLIDMAAQAEALNITLTAESNALYGLGQTLGLNSTELLTYLWIRAIYEHDEAYLIIGQTTPNIFIGTGNEV